MRQLLILLASIFCISPALLAQTGSAFGMKGGLTLGTQKWNGSERDILPAYHSALTFETVNDSISLAFIAQVGYHVKGSAQRFRSYYNPNTQRQEKGRTLRYPYEQVSLVLGLKNSHDLGKINGYYLLGIRGDYLIRYKQYSANSEAFKKYVNNLKVGATIGGGFDYKLESAPLAFFVEFTINPDITKQVFLPGGTLDYYDVNGNLRTYPEQNVTNMSYEISLGVKYIRKITWVEEWEDDALLPMHTYKKKSR